MPSEAYVQLVSTQNSDVTPSCLVFTDQSRHLFNLGEGWQRVAMEHGVRVARVTDMYLTRIAPNAVGGLPGCLLTMNDLGANELRLHGPPSLLPFLLACRHFVNGCHTKFEVHIPSPDHRNVHVDSDGTTVLPVVIPHPSPPACGPSPSLPLLREGDCPEVMQQRGLEDAIAFAHHHDHTSFACLKNDGPQECHKSAHADQPACKRARHSAITTLLSASLRRYDSALVDTALGTIQPPLQHLPPPLKAEPRNEKDGALPDETRALASAIVVYICHLAPIRGKFDPAKALALGVPKGPLFGALTRGEAVQLEGDREVRPEDVLAPATAGPVVIVVDCPEEAFLDPLVSHPQFRDYYLPDGAADQRQRVSAIVHMSPGHVVRHPKFIAWANRFGPDVKHILSNEPFCAEEVVFLGQLRHQCVLNKIQASAFPIPHFALSPQSPPPAELKQSRAARCLTKYSLVPQHKRGFSEGLQQQFDPKEFQEANVRLSESTAKLVQAYRERADKPATPSQKFANELVAFLGTGSAVPSKYRNVSGIYLSVDGPSQAMLLDVGEGTYGQLARLFGPQRIQEIIKGIRCAWVSHMHADHHLGLVRVLTERQKICDRPLVVLGPAQLGLWLHEFAACSGTPLAFEFVNLQQHDSPLLRESLCDQLGFTEVEHVPVDHCPHAFGFVATHRRGWKIAYSGDTRPCERFVQAGLGADVLIHEATFEDDMQGEAVARKHSTYSEAMDVGARMKAGRVVLTHFSQRYPKLPNLSDEASRNVIVAFDMLLLRLADLEKLDGLYGVVKDVLEEVHANKAD